MYAFVIHAILDDSSAKPKVEESTVLGRKDTELSEAGSNDGATEQDKLTKGAGASSPKNIAQLSTLAGCRNMTYEILEK